MGAVLWLINTILQLYLYAVIAWVILSWLFIFNVINRYSPIVVTIEQFLNAIIAPLLNPIRRFVPLMGGIDISPLILIIVIEFVRRFIRSTFVQFMY